MHTFVRAQLLFYFFFTEPAEGVQAGFASLSVIVPSPIVSFGVPAFFCGG